MLKVYYEKQKKIDYLKGRYNKFSRMIQETKQCISETKHTLDILIPSQRYDNDRVMTSKMYDSPQERALLESEELMERKIRNFFVDQSDCLIERLDLENECQKLTEAILLLDEIDQSICKMRYKDQMSYSRIGDIAHADPTTIRRKMKKIHNRIIELLEFIS